MTEQTASSLPLQMDETQVVGYLRSNPDFFVRHEALLQDLRLPHASGRAISLVERQVHLFREQRDSSRREIVNLIAIARHNDRLFEKSKRLLMQLIESESLVDLAQVLDDSIRNDFGLDAATLVLFDRKVDVPGGITTSVSKSEGERILGSLLEGQRAVCGQFNPEQLALLFPYPDRKILSAAVISLRHTRPLGVLAVGSLASQYFDSSMGSLFLSYISDTLSRLLPPMLLRHVGGGGEVDQS